MNMSRILATKPAKIITVVDEDSIRTALARLAEYRIGALVVLDSAGELCGILSERDIVRRAVVQEDLFDLPVREVMTPDVIVGVPQDEIMSVAHIMTERRLRHLPIVDEKRRLIGMISIGDVMKAQRDAYRGEIDTLEQQVMTPEE